MSSGSASPVYYAEGDDPELKTAMERARDTFKYHWRELTWEYRRIIPALELSAIKVGFKDPDGGPDDVEHMWCSEIEFDGDEIAVRLLNSPNTLKSVKAGDPVMLRKEQIEDWMYVMGGAVYGGFTIQVLRARMSSGERRGHDSAWGLKFPDPSRIDLVPNFAERGSKGMLGRLFGGASPPGDPEVEHPMSENMAPALADAVAKDRAGFLELGPSGLSTLHSFALGGSAACVAALLRSGADPRLKTKHGKTARELAMMMGWPRVEKLLLEAEARTLGRS
jgi:uncharacterized protein